MEEGGYRKTEIHKKRTVNSILTLPAILLKKYLSACVLGNSSKFLKKQCFTTLCFICNTFLSVCSKKHKKHVVNFVLAVYRIQSKKRMVSVDVSSIRLPFSSRAAAK